ncbi:hypothetical protein Emag_004604 [Eimeria magna]
MGDYVDAEGAPQGASQGPSSGSSSGGLLPIGGPSGSNVSHRLADIGRSFLARFSSVPQTSQFVDKGTLTPQEFVDAGDLLVFKFPTWQWEAAVGKRVNSWLPPDKQFLVTRGVACHRRVRDIEASLNINAKEDAEGWVLPVDDEHDGPQEAQSLPSTASPARGKADPSPADPPEDVPTPPQDLGGGALPDLKNLRDLDSLLCENGTPLTPVEIFEDILTDYAAKTVTVDPHPCTGVPTASIHPCKPDLALIVLLKFISSVIPTIDYDFTMDIDMGLCGPAPSKTNA